MHGARHGGSDNVELVGKGKVKASVSVSQSVGGVGGRAGLRSVSQHAQSHGPGQAGLRIQTGFFWQRLSSTQSDEEPRPAGINALRGTGCSEPPRAVRSSCRGVVMSHDPRGSFVTDLNATALSEC
ncbi:hypothetical protein EYF80_045423 [Liparis tanakae]|uniref:Uncharacterized protein n=1 Tax=Liparis tanakae TaxID=230148 RepID=A0A4Z2FT27_9TELE|nr:hypothetical protein EYF80_045423 [Liparis tanakae]